MIEHKHHLHRRILVTGPSPLLQDSDTTAEIPEKSSSKQVALAAGRAFAVRCEPHDSKRDAGFARGLSLSVSQRVSKGGVAHAWDSIIVQCDEEPDGSLTTRIIVSNPDWNERLQIACIRSCPDDAECLTALGCNLDHRRIDS